MAKKKGKKSRSKQMKIPILTVAGVAVMLKRLYDVWKANPGDEVIAMTEAMTGWNGRTETFDWKQLVFTYAPPIAGGLASKYIGGPKGLNVNAQLRNVPFLKL